MSAQLIGTFEPGSPEWHAARANGLGGSEIAAVLGLHPFESHYSLWLRKKGIIGPATVNAPMEWGNRLEDAVAQKFADEHPAFDVSRTGTWQSHEHGWQIANPDRILISDYADPQLLEIKTARYDDGWGEPGGGEIPPHYLAQCQHYLDVLELKVCHVAVLFSGSDYREYVVRANADDQAYMRRAGEAFMASLANDERPSIDTHDATYEAVRAEHPDIDRDLKVPIGPDLWIEYESTKAAAEVATAAHRKAKAEVLDAMGDARIATVAGEPVLRRQPSRGGVALYPVARKKAAA